VEIIVAMPFSKAIKFDIGDLCVDIFFRFDYSTKRKNL